MIACRLRCWDGRWYARQDSNLHFLAPEASALSIKLRARSHHLLFYHESGSEARCVLPGCEAARVLCRVFCGLTLARERV